MAPGALAEDASYPGTVGRVPVPADRLRTLRGLVHWTLRARRLARSEGSRFLWCDTLRPAGHVVREVHRGCGIPYGLLVHGSDLLMVEAKAAGARWKRWVARRLFGGAAAVAANSRWTAAVAARVMAGLGLESAVSRIRVVPLGSDSELFRPGADPSGVQRAYGLPAGRWLLTVARLVPHKGFDRVLEALARLGLDRPDRSGCSRGPV